MFTAALPEGTTLLGTIYQKSDTVAPVPCGLLLRNAGGVSAPYWTRRRDILGELRPYTQELAPLLGACFQRHDPTCLGYVRARHMGALLQDLLVWSHFRPWDFNGSCSAGQQSREGWEAVASCYRQVRTQQSLTGLEIGNDVGMPREIDKFVFMRTCLLD